MTATPIAVPSFTTPGRRYQTTVDACNCPGFTFHRRPCRHMKALREGLRPVHRPIKIIGREREQGPVCEHGAACLIGSICPTCGTNRRELHAVANGHASMTAAQRACWMGQCGRDGGQ